MALFRMPLEVVLLGADSARCGSDTITTSVDLFHRFDEKRTPQSLSFAADLAMFCFL